jgi:predicted N-acetyltransferase YhbS
MVCIRLLTLQDIESADEVARAAFRVEQSFRPRFRRYLEMCPDGWLVAQDRGRVVGTVGAISYESFAYLGLLAVDPSWQGQGLGRHLLETILQRLREAGRDCAVLDASDAGRHLYERSGFEAVGPSVVLVLDPPGAAVVAASPRNVSQLPMVVSDLNAGREADRADVVALDRELFGADRGTVWGVLLREPGTKAWLVRGAGGDTLGYLCVQEQQIGPWGARTGAAAVALLAEAVSALPPRSWRVQLPGDNVAGRELLTSLGFAEQRSLLHMRRGTCAGPPGWRYVYGKGSFCLG